MFTKVFRSIYDGTLADHWKALITFQQFLILCDQQGVVDMTLSAMSRTTGIPIEILAEGVQHLEAPDPMSRTPDMEGRRIARLDSHREWGWFLVNFQKYRELRSQEEKREADRTRIATKRDRTRQLATTRDTSPEVANVAHTEAEADKETTPNGVVVDSGEQLPLIAHPAGQPKRPAIPDAPHDQIVAEYHRLLPMCPAVRTWTPKRQALLRQRWRESPERQTVAWWSELFEFIATRCPFLTGKVNGGHRDPFVADLEWLLLPSNLVKVSEGRYEQQGGSM